MAGRVSRRALTVIVGAAALVAIAAVVMLAWRPWSQPTPAPTSFSSWYPMTNADGDAAFADFENHVPCEIESPVPDGCERVKYGIALYRDAAGDPTTYLISIVRVGVSDDRETHEGTWHTTTGTGLDPDAPVYELDANAPAHLRHYWAVGKDILFLLDEDLMPRVGDAAYGYALNSVPLGKRNVAP